MKMERYHGFELREPSDQEFTAWFGMSVAQQAEDRAYVNGTTIAEERERLEPLIARILPEGKDTPDHFFRILSADGSDNIGFVWLGIMPGMDAHEIMLMDIMVKETYRRKGYGKLMLSKMHQAMKREGYQRILLYVLDKNPARFMYRDLGYKTVKTEDKSALMMIGL